MKAKKRSTKKPAVKRKRNTKAPSAKQLAARRKFAAAAKARSKKTVKKRNKTIIVKPKRVLVVNGNRRSSKTKNPIVSKKLKQTVYGVPIYDVWYQRPNSNAMAYGYTVGNSDKFIRHWKSAIATAKRLSTSKAKNPKKRRNSSTAIDNRKEFAGKYTGDLTLHFPQKSLSGLSTLGPLVLLEGEFGTIKPTRGGVYYCQDAKGRIHIGAKSADDLWARVKENLGTVRRVEYRAKKPHLGYPQETVWYHDFEAPYPVLKSDGQGGLMQVGGGYKIRREGIVG